MTMMCDMHECAVLQRGHPAPPRSLARRPAHGCLRVGVLVALLLAASACQRPFEEAARPRIHVLDPDLSIIQTDRQIQLALRVTSSVDIEQVLAGPDTLSFDEDQNSWLGRHVMTNGLNRIVVSITDADMRTTHDTLYAMVHTVMVSQTGPHLPAPRGGHTATQLHDGTTVVIGGAPHAGGPALATALMLEAGASAFAPIESQLTSARAGHTATRLPDGRILIVGGSTVDDVRRVDALVETVEIFNPLAQTFEVIPVEGEPIRRTYHTASLHEEDGEVFIDLYGGTGDVSYRPPILGTRSDVRRFRVEDDALFALDPAPGPTLSERLSGHSQVELFPNALIAPRFYVAGAQFGDGFTDDVSFELEYHSTFGLLQHAVAPLYESRSRHAAILLLDGFVGIFGGWKGSQDEVLSITEIYSAIAQRSFRYPESAIGLARYAHTATNAENQRIRIIGGFSSGGDGLAISELHRMPNFDPGVTGTRGR